MPLQSGFGHDWWWRIYIINTKLNLITFIDTLSALLPTHAFNKASLPVDRALAYNGSSISICNFDTAVTGHGGGVSYGTSCSSGRHRGLQSTKKRHKLKTWTVYHKYNYRRSKQHWTPNYWQCNSQDLDYLNLAFFPVYDINVYQLVR